MGQPALPTKRQVEQLKVASQIIRKQLPWTYDAETLHLEIVMPPQAIAAVTVEMVTERTKGDAQS
jgi:hypothetical protein